MEVVDSLPRNVIPNAVALTIVSDFKNMDHMLYKIAQLANTRLFESGKVVLKESEEVRNLYLIRKGVCVVTKSIRPYAARSSEENLETQETAESSWAVNNASITKNRANRLPSVLYGQKD